MSFHENLRRARKMAEMTQQELAEAVEVCQKDISRWENGKRTPGLDSLVKICRALEVSADDLLEIWPE